MMSRKWAVALIVVLVAGIGVWSMTREKQPQPYTGVPMRIITATDLHYLSPRLHDEGEAFLRILSEGDGKYTQESEGIVRTFLDDVKSQKPDLLLLTGDVSFNGEKLSHQEMAKMLADVEAAGVRVIVLPGNHDIEYPEVARYEGDKITEAESVTAQEFAEIYHDFGYDEAIARDADSLSCVIPLNEAAWLLCVDVNGVTARHQDPDWDRSHTYVMDSTLKWVGDQLEEARRQGVTVIAASHQNIRQHNSEFREGFVMENAEKLQALYHRNGVAYNFSGHMHVQHISSVNGLTDFATSSLTTWPLQYGVIDLSRDGLRYDTARVPVSAELADAAKEFFDAGTRQQMSGFLGTAGTKPILQSVTEINRQYFAGYIEDREQLAELAALLEDKMPESFLTRYIHSMEADEAKDNNHWNDNQ